MDPSGELDLNIKYSFLLTTAKNLMFVIRPYLLFLH